MSIKKILRDPLSHFLVAGFVIYFALSFGEKHEEIERIVIDREALIEFIQYRSKAFDEAKASRRLEQMSDVEIRDLIQQFRREEALYREARKLGMEQGDYVIRQRLVGKMEFLSDRETSIPDPGNDKLERFFERNKPDYAKPAVATFVHVFLSRESKPVEVLTRDANAVLENLVASDVGPDRAAKYGDRFLFRTRYVDQGYSIVAAELGGTAADAIFSNRTSLNDWFGPVQSDYGAHLIFLTAKTPARTPELAEIRDQVLDDYARLKRQELQLALEQVVISAYEVEVAGDLQEWIDARMSQLSQPLVSLRDGDAE